MLFKYIKKEWQIKTMAVFFFTAREKGFTFHAYMRNPKLAHILVGFGINTTSFTC